MSPLIFIAQIDLNILMDDIKRLFGLDYRPKAVEVLWNCDPSMRPGHYEEGLRLTKENVEATLRMVQKRGGVDRLFVHASEY